MKNDQDEPPNTNASPAQKGDGVGPANNTIDLTQKLTQSESEIIKRPFLARLKSALLGKSDKTLREALEEYAETPDGPELDDSFESHEKLLITNILKLRNLTVLNVMVPRADIVAIEADATQEDLFALLAEKQHTRIPVYRNTLDDVMGALHIKDIMTTLAMGQALDIKDLTKEVPVVSPTMPILDLLLQMQETRRHMAFVVDEFGGIDGLVTIGDAIETIVGEIEDEYDSEQQPEMDIEKDGTVLADGRVDIKEFEQRFGSVLSNEEREESDTLGGLVFLLAGRVPARGEILTHDSGMAFEVLDAGPRRVERLKITNIPENA